MSEAQTDPANAEDVDLADAEGWVRSRVPDAGPLRLIQTEPWGSVFRARVGDAVVWFKACATRQAVEVPLTAALADRWPDVVSEVLAHDVERRWILMADAGQPLDAFGNPPERWLEILPRYAELQIGEAEHAGEHLTHGVPDLGVERLPGLYEELLRAPLPLDAPESETWWRSHHASTSFARSSLMPASIRASSTMICT